MKKKEKMYFEKLRSNTEKFKNNYFDNLELSGNLIKSIKILIQNKSSYSFIASFLDNYEKKFETLKNQSNQNFCKLKRHFLKYFYIHSLKQNKLFHRQILSIKLIIVIRRIFKTVKKIHKNEGKYFKGNF